MDSMDSFYKDLYRELDSFHKVIFTKHKKLFQHNHQPVQFIVNDCMYCKLYGNVVCNLNLNSDNDILHIGTTQDTITNSIHYKLFD